MTAAIGKYAAKKMLSSQLKQYQKKEPAGPYDPYYEYRTDSRTGRKKKYKKQIPSYIPSHDADILASVRKRAYRLDMSLFNFLGIRFGWSSVIGLVPAFGDGLDGVMALNLVRKCNQVEGGLPQSILLHMLVWVFIDFIIGLVPFAGDLLDASIKANSKNVRILEQHLDKKYKPKELSRREREDEDAAKRRGQEYHPPAPATVYEDFSEEEDLPQYSTRPSSPGAGPRRPDPARVPTETRGGPREERRQSKGWTGGRSGSRRERDRPSDVEMAQTRDQSGRSGSRRY